MNIVKQQPQSVLFITLDSCRYDTFVSANARNLKSVGKLYQAIAPSYFTYGSHQAMFVGFTPGIAEVEREFINPKYGKIFRMKGSAAFNYSGSAFSLEGANIIQGFKRQGFLTIGSGAVAWFNPQTETGKVLSQDFEHFFYAENTYSLNKQLTWIYPFLNNTEQPLFLFLNIGETHVPYYYEGAKWDRDYNPCIPFSQENNAEECRLRQLGCIEFIDYTLAPLLNAFQNSNIFICADHGDCWGEDGLWEHGFHHPKVLEVPLIFRLNKI